MKVPKSLIRKYNIPGPRYTSYPTAPFWKTDGINLAQWKQQISASFSKTNSNEGISIYIHLPFCEKLCTFCACHKQITKKHSVELPYIESLLSEWNLYCELFDSIPQIKEIHLGGGTPTFFSPENLAKLIEGILTKAKLHPEYVLSFEAHPSNTKQEHLNILYGLGFRRISFGVQDYDLKVQKAINRIQPYELVVDITNRARATGFNSVSHDLVFGLPHQTVESISDTIKRTGEIEPDRIAFYSYAHVPWIKGVGQRGYSESDIPQAEEKRTLYEVGKEHLLDLGYIEIGMDHFSLKSDSLLEAMQSHKLHRNFMGYTAGKTDLLVGLGMSSIGDTWTSFGQNLKTVKDYQESINAGKLPIFRGHLLTQEDLIIRQHLLNIMCNFNTSWSEPQSQFPELEQCLDRLSELEKDGLVEISNQRLSVPEFARPFIRNICMAFDMQQIRSQPQGQLFSLTI